MTSSHAIEEALLAALSVDPDDVNALDGLGMLAARTGRLDAALSALSRAAELAPHDAQIQIHLAHVYHDRGEWEAAQLQYARALYLAPNDAPAHEGAAYTAMRLQDFESAEKHRRQAFRDRVLTVSTVDVAAPTVLLVVSSRGGNVDTRPYLAAEAINVIKLVADELDGIPQLPEYDYVFHGIGDSDHNFNTIVSLLSRTSPLAHIFLDAKKPVLNHPRQVLATSRAENARRLAGIPGVRTARTLTVERTGDVADDAFLLSRGFRFPFLVRALGYHTGEHFARVDGHAQLEAVCEAMPGDALLGLEFLDTQSPDRHYRKYRLMHIGGELYPAHLAVGDNWKVHYMHSLTPRFAAFREEERRFLADPKSVIGSAAYEAVEAIFRMLGLDYAGIDFALDAEGSVVCFEANANMVVAMPGKGIEDRERRIAARAIHDAAKRLFRL
jgi:glutathione synthase/RimK-type ligase-like ATP-grasp enzyme